MSLKNCGLTAFHKAAANCKAPPMAAWPGKQVPCGAPGQDRGCSSPAQNPSAGQLGIRAVLSPEPAQQEPQHSECPTARPHTWYRTVRDKSLRAKVLNEQSREGLDEHKETIPAKFLRDHQAVPTAHQTGDKLLLCARISHLPLPTSTNRKLSASSLIHFPKPCCTIPMLS